MTQAIDAANLKAAAEYLEWVLLHYPDSDDVQGLRRALAPLIEDAKAGRIEEPMDSGEVPGTYNNADGVYIQYRNPSVGDAYAKFKVELAGGLADQDKKRHAEMEAFKRSLLNGES